jgi:hypothetical protein
MSRLLVLAYLVAIVAANWSVSHWGPRAAVYNAFILIGLDLVARDRLHDAWRAARSHRISSCQRRPVACGCTWAA